MAGLSLKDSLKDIGGLSPDDPLFKEFEAMLVSYEARLCQKNGRKTRAHRTRAKLSKVGIIKCLESWAMRPKATEGYKLLVESGHPLLRRIFGSLYLHSIHRHGRRVWAEQCDGVT